MGTAGTAGADDLVVDDVVGDDALSDDGLRAAAEDLLLLHYHVQPRPMGVDGVGIAHLINGGSAVVIIVEGVQADVAHAEFVVVSHVSNRILPQ